MPRSDRERIEDILRAIDDIRADTGSLDYAGFSGSPAIVRSVLYSIGIMGEAAKHLSPEFKAQCPDVPWRAIAGMRDRIIHEYFRTNSRRVWDVVTEDLDPLERTLRETLAGHDQGRNYVQTDPANR
jgi:uncharacterized protein with HEPN domain